MHISPSAHSLSADSKDDCPMSTIEFLKGSHELFTCDISISIPWLVGEGAAALETEEFPQFSTAEVIKKIPQPQGEKIRTADNIYKI